MLKEIKKTKTRFSVDGLGCGTSARALPYDGVVQWDPFAETGRVPVLTVPTEDDNFAFFGGAAGHSGRE